MNDYLIEELQEKKELIKDLSNECVSLRGINTGLKKENKDLIQRIDKAIEYINKHKKPLHHYFDEPDCDYWIATNPDDILDILKGE